MTTPASADAAGGGPPPGSLRYFAILFSPPDSRPFLNALYALEFELRAAADSQSHEAAHARILWWKDELNRFISGAPAHPVTRALLPLQANLEATDRKVLHDLAIAADLDLAGLAYDTEAEMQAYCQRSAGSLQTVIAAVLAPGHRPSENERRFARALGSALRQTEMLRDFHPDLRRGRRYLPTERIEACGLNPQTPGPAMDAAALAGLLREWRVRVAEDLARLPDLLDERERATQRHGLVLGALHARLLEEIGRSDTSLPDAAPAIVPPLARLWTAWRTAVRYS